MKRTYIWKGPMSASSQHVLRVVINSSVPISMISAKSEAYFAITFEVQWIKIDDFLVLIANPESRK